MQAHCLLQGPALNSACPHGCSEAVSNMVLTSYDHSRVWNMDKNSKECETFEEPQTNFWNCAAGMVGSPDYFSTSRTEHNNSWGDFEGFAESTCKSENFNNTAGVLVQLPAPENLQNVAALNEMPCTTSDGLVSEPTEHNRSYNTADSGTKISLHYEDIFKFCFPDIPVQHSSENVIGLREILETSSEEKGAVELMKAHLGVDSVDTWRTVHSMTTGSGIRSHWNESLHCQKSLMLALGIDTDQNNTLDSADHLLGETNLKDAEELTEVDGFGLNGSQTLIQTKLSVSPDSKSGRFFTYRLFLKKVPVDNVPSRTFPTRPICCTESSKNENLKYFFKRKSMSCHIFN